MLVAVPSDPLKPHRPTEHFAVEYDCARALGLDIGLVDHDALAAGDADAGIAALPTVQDVVYRGWMLNAERYRAFESAVAARGGSLRASAEQYRTAHELPGWIAAVREFTAQAEMTVTDSFDDFDAVCAQLGSGPAVLRDYVRSAKHYWTEAVFIPDVSDRAAARSVAARFRDIRDDDFAGGFVLRRFETYVSTEARTWWIDGSCALVTAHPDTPDSVPEDYVEPPGLAGAIKAMELPFVTADLAQRDDGAWRLIEIGDGQVSDRPRTTDPAALLAALNQSDKG